jgi:SLT domain-containing protein
MAKTLVYVLVGKDELSRVMKTAGKNVADSNTVMSKSLDNTGKSSARLGGSFTRMSGVATKALKFVSIGILGAGGIGAALSTLPALAAASGALAGIALGAKFLVGSKAAKGPLYAQWTQMVGGLKTVMQGAVTPLITPLRQAFTSIGTFAKQMGPTLKAVFGSLGPLVMPMTKGLEALIAGVLPGFIALMHAALPAVSALGGVLGVIGRSIGGLMSALAPGLNASAGVIKMLGGLLGTLMPLLGRLASTFAGVLGPVLADFGKALQSFLPIFGIILVVLGKVAGSLLGVLAGALQSVGQVLLALAPAFALLASAITPVLGVFRALTPVITIIIGVVGKVAGILLGVLASALKIVAGVLQALAPAFAVLAGVVETVFTALQKSGVFSTLASLLTSLAGPLAAIVVMLVTGLAPIFKVLIGIIAKVAGALLAGLAKAVIALMPSLLLLVQALLRLATQVLMPLLGPVMQLANAWVKMELAILPLLPPILQLATLLINLAILVLVPVARLLSVLIGWLAKLAMIVANVITWIVKIVAAGLTWVANFAKVRGAVMAVVNWITGHWPGLLATLTNPIVSAKNNIVRAWGEISHGASVAFNAVVGWFRSLPGKISGALGSMNTLLLQKGKDVIGGLWSGMKWVWDHGPYGWLKSLANLISKIKGPLSFDAQLLIPHGKSIMMGFLKGLTKGWATVSGFLSGVGSAIGGIFGIGGGSGVARWTPLVDLALAMLGLPLSLAGQVLYQMQTESGGNPNAINLTDSNAMAGHPSQGLLQTIPSTFAAYHVAGTSWNIVDPLANIAAAINYARARYGPTLMSGGMGMGSGHGYALGTRSASPGWAWVGEHGRELMHFRGGESVIPHSALSGRGGGGDHYYSVTVNVQGHALASKREIGRTVADALKEFKAKGGNV